MYELFMYRSFAQQIDLSGMHVDVALRKFQTYFRIPVRVIKTDTLELVCLFAVNSIYLLVIF